MIGDEASLLHQQWWDDDLNQSYCPTCLLWYNHENKGTDLFVMMLEDCKQQFLVLTHQHRTRRRTRVYWQCDMIPTDGEVRNVKFKNAYQKCPTAGKWTEVRLGQAKIYLWNSTLSYLVSGDYTTLLLNYCTNHEEKLEIEMVYYYRIYTYHLQSAKPQNANFDHIVLTVAIARHVRNFTRTYGTLSLGFCSTSRFLSNC